MINQQSEKNKQLSTLTQICFAGFVFFLLMSINERGYRVGTVELRNSGWPPVIRGAPGRILPPATYKLRISRQGWKNNKVDCRGICVKIFSDEVV